MMKIPQYKWLCFLSLITVLFYGSIIYGQEGTGTVEGVVLEDGQPVVGIKVVMISSVTSSYEGVGLTNLEGNFSVSDVPAGGEVFVNAYSEKDQVIGKAVSLLNAGDTIFLRIDLSIPPS